MTIKRHSGTCFQLISLAMLPILSVIQTIWGQGRVELGLYSGAPLCNRLYFHFLHGGVFHLLFNWWCLVSLSFLYCFGLLDVVIALAVAASYPFAGAASIVGLSAFDYALAGIMVMDNGYQGKYNTWFLLLIVILIQGLLPNIGIGIHLWSFALGSVYGLTKWICRKK